MSDRQSHARYARSSRAVTRDYLADVLAIHADQIAIWQADGVRDPGQLEAALFRPQSGYYADRLQAAALWEACRRTIVDGQGHGFRSRLTPFSPSTVWTDGDAGEAWTSACPASTHRREFAFSVLDAWLRDHTKPRG